MRTWNLKAGDPLVLTLAADARLGPTDYLDDQIWELDLGGGEPPALALQTTFGLRARSLRLFPRFVEGDHEVSDPAEFASPPRVHCFYPNYLRLSCQPLAEIEVQLEFWLPGSHVIAGRLTFSNLGGAPRVLRLDWVSQLAPTEGERMAPAEMGNARVLAGQTANLAPVLFMTGGPQAFGSPYPALVLEVDLPAAGETGAGHPPAGSRRLTWCQAALADPAASFELARSTAARNWDAEIARLEMLDTAQVEIYTGQTAWDAALAFSQKQAFSLFAGPTEHLPAPSLLLTRQPDQGFSLRGDGSDYNHLWNGQSPLEAWYLANLILPGAPELAKGLLLNYLAVQETGGFIDWKPGLAGQRSRLLATPLLASLAWRIYQHTEDRTFLEEVLPRLLDFFHAWFDPLHDRDGDGVPEWDHPSQAGFEDHPLFTRWESWSQGVDIEAVESPGLCAMLYRECQHLLAMARLVQRTHPVTALQSLADGLRTALEAAWDPVLSCYHYWDRDSHLTPTGRLLGERTGPGSIAIHQDFDPPARLLVSVETDSRTPGNPLLFVHGAGGGGQSRVERIDETQFTWNMGQGRMTGQRVYTRLERLELHDIAPSDRVMVSQAGFDHLDYSSLLPLWAGIPSQEQADELVQCTLQNPECFQAAYGIPACPAAGGEAGVAVCRSVHLPWNALIGEGLLAYGYRQEAALLVERLMGAVIANLGERGEFRRTYHADSGQGRGERNALPGLAPVGLFLETLGVRFISPHRVYTTGFNPYPWPVTVKYRGTTALCHADRTVITFPDGQSVTVEDPAPQLVALEHLAA